MAKASTDQRKVIEFVRKRDYKFVRALGQGACGQTVLLHDDYIDAYFVCKKYVPYSESVREELFKGFVKEVSLLHRLHHDNVVRVFNYYLYPEQFMGYILMEFVDGKEIDKFIQSAPERINDIFLQAVSGFAYLEQQGILHRDIRPGNLMVRADGNLKIIDLGFGKHVRVPADFEKSINLNWWVAPPKDFEASRYSFSTEVYFVGKLFERMIQDGAIEQFAYSDLLREMCKAEPKSRIGSFSEIDIQIRNNKFHEIQFGEWELDEYRAFASAMTSQITKIEKSARFVDDVSKITKSLADIYRKFMLETEVPDAAMVLRCFIDGTYYYKRNGLGVACVKDFLALLKNSSTEKANLIIANLHTRLSGVPRYDQTRILPDVEIPF